MQEEMTNQMFEVGGKTVSVVIKCADVTLDVLHDILKALLNNQSKDLENGVDKKSTKRGKQSVKSLLGQGQGVENIDINSDNIGLFTSSARKYGVDFAMTKDKNTEPPTHTIFFKGKDTAAITSAFKDFVGREENKIAKDNNRSLNKELKKLKKELGEQGKGLSNEQLKEIHSKRQAEHSL